MLNVSDLLAGTRDMVVDFGNGNELKLTYDPTQITANLLVDLSSDSDELCKILSELVVDWDLEDGEGKPFEPTHDNIANNMSLIVVNKIFEAIFSDAFPKATSTTSEDTTQAKARRVTRKVSR